jgi:hypothetical protein
MVSPECAQVDDRVDRHLARRRQPAGLPAAAAPMSVAPPPAAR